MRRFIIKPGDLIPIGRAGENQATQIRFDVTGWADTFGVGTYTLVVKRPHEDTAYPVEVVTDGDYVVWTVSNVDTGIAGNASVQLRYVVDGALAKSVIYTGIVGESLDNIVDPPDPFEDLIQRMVDLTERTEAAATSAAGSAASATEAAGTATAAKIAAEAANTAAQSAKTAAQSANTDAQSAKTDAQSAKNAAEAARSAAASSATAASGLATAAAGSASQAAASATAADASATAAAASAAAAQAAAMNVIDKAPIITDTASGAIASFPDGTDAQIKQLTVNIEPQQDLHGYDNPWTGGNGKNLLPITATTQTVSGVTFTVNTNGSVTVNGTASESVAFTLNSTLGNVLTSGTNYVLSGSPTNSDTTKWKYRVYNVSDSIDTGNGVTFEFRSGRQNEKVDIVVYSGTTMSNVVFWPMICLATASNPTAYEPYENICPITGWTGANVVRAGKNLWNNDWYSGLTQITDTSDAFYGYYGGSIKTWSTAIRVTTGRFIPKGASQMTVTAELGNVHSNGDFKFVIYFQYNDGTTSSSGIIILSAQEKRTVTYTSTAGKTVTGFSIDTTAGTGNLRGCIRNVMVSVDGSTDYEAPVRTSYPITWQTEAGTVYGGHWTANQDGSVTLVADRAYVDLGSFDYTRITGSINVFRSSSAISGIKGHATASGSTGSVCERYVEGTSETIANGKFYIGATIYSYANKINIRDDNFTDADLFKTSVTGTKLVYPLATPITYTLTASEMTTLFGQNNWWADCGDIAEIEYRCDTRRYIDKKLAALLAALS